MYNLIGYIQQAHLINVSTVWNRHEKDCRLADLMTEMEIKYKIPMFSDPEWEKHNQDVIIAYRGISNMRSL